MKKKNPSKRKLKIKTEEPKVEAATAEENSSATAPTATVVTSTEFVPEVTSSEDKSTTEAAATMLELGQQNAEQTVSDIHQNALVTASEAVGKSDDGNTYLLVVDENSQLDQLNSQTFYIDSNSLANGDLTNMVLTTESGQPIASSNGHPIITNNIQETTTTVQITNNPNEQPTEAMQS